MTTSATKDVYVLTTEIEILPTSDVYEGEGHMFCFVSCVCCAANKQDAISEVKFALSNEGMKLLRVEQIRLYRESVWEEKEHQEEIDRCASEALKTGEVTYSRFSCYHE